MGNTMRSLLALLATLLLTSACPAAEATEDRNFIQRQKNIVQLLIRVHQENLFKEQANIGNQYDIESHKNNYKDPQLVEDFLAAYRDKDLLPRGEVFSVLNKKHVQQAEQAFNLFYQANDYDTFYSTACWARDRLNEGLFVYAFCIAVVHRSDTQDVILPPPYEVLPEHFTPSRVIQQAYRARMRLAPAQVVIPSYCANISSPEEKVAYFTEDVQLNAYNTYLSYLYPVWMKSHQNGPNARHRGTMFFYSRQQLLARYHLERLSVGLPGVETLNLNIDLPVQVGYAPHLRYKNGEEFPMRPQGVLVHGNYLVNTDIVKTVEARLRDVIDSGTLIEDSKQGPRRVFLKDTDAIDVLGNLVHGNADSLNRCYFKSLYLMLLTLYGHIVDPIQQHKVAPGPMEHFETLLRDPIYYHIVKHIVQLIQEYQNQLPSYSHQELIAPGITIESAGVDKLITFDEAYEYSLNGVVDVANIAETSQLDIRASQRRLNHEPYTIYIDVSSDQAITVIIRVFLGPKFDSLGNELSLEQKRSYMVEIDQFLYQLHAGKNRIERNSTDSNAINQDQITIQNLLTKTDIYHLNKTLPISTKHRQCGFPHHLQIPRGNKDGLQLSFFVTINPYEGEEINVQKPNTRQHVLDNRNMGFPFDRKINAKDFTVPNVYMKDVVVYHKTN